MGDGEGDGLSGVCGVCGYVVLRCAHRAVLGGGHPAGTTGPLVHLTARLSVDMIGDGGDGVGGVGGIDGIDGGVDIDGVGGVDGCGGGGVDGGVDDGVVIRLHPYQPRGAVGGQRYATPSVHA